MNIPNTLSVLRLLMAPALLGLAWHGQEYWFVALLVLAFTTDALDGFIARRFHQETDLGAQLDTWGDAAIYVTLPIAAWWLWPAVIVREFPWMMLIVGSVAAPALLGFAKFRMSTSYHTYLVKVAAAITACASLWLFLAGHPIPFRAAAILCVIAALEEVVITMTLNKPRSNVRSLWHVLRERNAER